MLNIATFILGMRTSEQMGLITMNYKNISSITQSLSRFDDVFNEEIGTYSDCTHLSVNPNAKPVVILNCRVLINLKK